MTISVTPLTPCVNLPKIVTHLGRVPNVGLTNPTNAVLRTPLPDPDGVV